MDLPVDLDREPRPVQGCKVCAALEYDKTMARSRGDWSAVSDCNVRLRKHEHRQMFQ
ncbi:hypothetical protein GCM10023237_48990 [Streptomyces coeruleoprunus]